MFPLLIFSPISQKTFTHTHRQVFWEGLFDASESGRKSKPKSKPKRRNPPGFPPGKKKKKKLEEGDGTGNKSVIWSISFLFRSSFASPAWLLVYVGVFFVVVVVVSRHAEATEGSRWSMIQREMSDRIVPREQ